MFEALDSTPETPLGLDEPIITLLFWLPKDGWCRGFLLSGDPRIYLNISSSLSSSSRYYLGLNRSCSPPSFNLL